MENKLWTCPRCGTDNWMSESKCNICGQRMPVDINGAFDRAFKVESNQNTHSEIVNNSDTRTISVPSNYKAIVFDLKNRDTQVVDKFEISKDKVNCLSFIGKEVFSFSINKNVNVSYNDNKLSIALENNEYDVTIKTVKESDGNNPKEFAKELLAGFRGFVTISNEDILFPKGRGFSNESVANKDKENNDSFFYAFGIICFIVQLINFIFFKNLILMIICVVLFFIFAFISSKVGTGSAMPMLGVLALITIIGMFIIIFSTPNTTTNSGNYDKNDPYFSANDYNKDGYLDDKEYDGAWKDFLNDKYKEYGY